MNPMSTSLNDVFAMFIMFRKAEGLAPRTLEWYQHVMNTLTRSPVGIPGVTPIEKIANHDLYRHVASLAEGGHGGKHLQSSSMNGHSRALRSFFNWAYKEGYTSEQLLKDFRPPKPAFKQVEVLTDAEISRLLIVTKNNLRDTALLMTMLDTGMRKAEVAGAKYRNIDFEEGFLKILGKGRKERLVLIGVRTRKYLMKYLRQSAGLRLPGVDNVFLSVHGGPLTGNGINMLFTRLRAKSGVERLHPHLLRHTFATRYLQGGGNALALKQLLGHSSYKMVDRYVHIVSAEAIRTSSGLSLLDRIASGRPVVNDMQPAMSRENVVHWPGAGEYDDRD